jgi:ATP synthase protein I
MQDFSDGRSGSRVGTVDLIIGLQVAVTLAAGLIVWLASGKGESAASAVWGGSIGFLSALVYVRVVRAARGRDPSELVKAHYLAQVLKFGVTIALFGVTFVVAAPIAPLPLFLTYIATLLTYWAGLIRYQDRYQDER